jgi:DNA-binding NarL/FixJ family response regulator
MSINVLIADDHAIVRDGLSALLSSRPGMNVIDFAVNGLEVIEKAISLHPDVIIMDISMPELNGIIATQRILDDYPDARIIMLSILGDPEHIFQALQSGAYGYLLKETAGREVIDAVVAVFSGKIYLSQPVMQTLIRDYIFHRGLPEKKSPLDLLSYREREVLQGVMEGKTSSEIAKILFLSPKTVETYRSRVMKKLDVPDLPSLIKYVVKEGLVS